MVSSLWSITSKDRMTANIIFVGATPINQWKLIQCMPVSFICAYAQPVTQHYTDREEYGEHEKHVFFPLWKCGKFAHDSVCPYNWWVTVKRRMDHYVLCFQRCLTFYRMFHTKDSMRNTFATTTVTKSSMKPWRDAAANHHLCGSGERDGVQRRYSSGQKKVPISVSYNDV